MVQARQSYAGSLPLTHFRRLGSSLAETGGQARYQLDFDRDAMGQPFLRVRVEAALPLQCQRSLDVYEEPVAIDQKLGLIRSERDEAALLPDFEPLLVAGDGQLDLADVIEDELILALPLIPTRPGEPLEHVESVDDGETEEPRNNPFAALAGLKKH